MTKHTKIFANETEYKNYISSAAYQTPVISVMNDKRYMGYNNRKEEIIATTESNSRLITIAQQKGWIPSTQTYLTKHECEAVTSIDLSGSNIQMFDEFRYFTSITTIEDNAFEYSDLISITLPNTITEIKFDAFYSCYNLKNIILPNSLKIIGYSAFEACQSLQSIIIPNSVTTIGVAAFMGCGLTHIEIPETVNQLNNCFCYCYDLVSVKLHEGLTKINDSAFAYCENLTNIDIPSTVTILGISAFHGCHKLSKVTFHGNSLTSIGNNCFRSCWNLHEIKLPESVTTISSYAFYDTPIKAINIPENVTTLSDYLFYGDAELTTIKLPKTVTTIGSYTFSHIGEQWAGTDMYSHNPLRITIPNNVSSIGSYCFSGLINEIKFETNTVPTINATTFSNLNLTFTKILVKKSDHPSYRNASYWSNIISYIHVY